MSLLITRKNSICLPFMAERTKVQQIEARNIFGWELTNDKTLRPVVHSKHVSWHFPESTSIRVETVQKRQVFKVHQLNPNTYN